MLATAFSWWTVSPKCYIEIVSSGILILPKERYLRRFSSVISSPNSSDATEQHTYLATKCQKLEENERQVTLIIDEISVRPHIAFSSNSLCGLSVNQKLKRATNVQSFMINSVYSSYKDVAALLPVHNSNAEELFQWTQNIIPMVQNCGYVIVAIITDNNRVNRNMLAKQCGGTIQTSIPNRSNDGKQIFILFDTVHIIKSVRNNWINQRTYGNTFTFPSINNSSDLLKAAFSDLVNIYEKEKNALIKYAPKLTFEALNPNNFDRQNVSLCLRVFDETNIAALKALMNDCDGTVEFLTTIINWWKIVNCKSTRKGVEHCDTYEMPFYSIDDERVAYFFSKLFHGWKLGSRPSCPIKEIKVDKYVLLGKYQTDPIEGRFGQYRQMHGGNYNISVDQIMKAEKRLRLKSLIEMHSSKFGNFKLKNFLIEFSDVHEIDDCDIDLMMDLIVTDKEMVFELGGETSKEYMLSLDNDIKIQNAMGVLCISVLVSALLVGLCLILFYCWYSTRHFKYWKEKNIPFVKPKPIFGSLFETLRKSLHVVEVERYMKYGLVYGHFEGSRPAISVADPALLRKILVTDFHVFPNRRLFATGEPVLDRNVAAVVGEDWKRLRSIITPTFTIGKIKRMMSIFKECSQVCVDNFMEYAKSGKSADTKIFFEALSMDVIASSAFSTKIDSQKDPNNKFVSSARQLFKTFFGWRFILLLMYPQLLKLAQLSAFPLKEVYFFKDMALKIIEERTRTGQVRNDFLQLLLDTAKETQDEETHEPDELTENYCTAESNGKVYKTTNKQKLSNIEVVAQCVLFFFAGFDAAASALSFVFYQLALNPNVQERLITELEEVLTFSDGNLTYEAIQKLKTFDNVISETLRMYSPAVRLERTANEDYDLGYKGIKLKKNMIVTIPIFAIHMDPKNYPEPEKFNPDRFLPEERSKRDQLVFMPFGYGPRGCIGMRFVLMMIKVCIAFLLSNFKFKKCAQTKEPLDFLPGQLLLRPKEIILQLELRKGFIKAK
ncbi:uncharacterized protein LOC129223056 [Uloborus diversus]|uniref:uncharacterized protein LOC129223056 n=1 Tax=Uloborus diversus TaxID=327109 RepID=UPI002409CCD2|nr:uncharacterized protein LOC129223056 [Uloborus diversus]